MYPPGMHKYLREWREYRNLSQEHVANVLGKRHTTIGRWERGAMKLSTDDLEQLARIYRASVKQLLAPPAAADMVATLDALQQIAHDMDPETLRSWIAIGQKLAAK